jgi:hypothetical protein
VLLSAVLLAPAVGAQSRDDVSGLGQQLRARYDILALQDGVGLVPKERTDTRVIEIRGGVVSVDGKELTGRELRNRLGEDADMILRVTYLDAAGQRTLAASGSGGATAPPPVAAVPGAVTPAPSSEAGDQPRRAHRSEISRVGGDVVVSRDEAVDGDVSVVMGSATINGEVSGDVNVVLGRLRLGPDALIRGDANVVGGGIDRAPTARVMGDTNDVAFGQWGPGRWSFPGSVMMPFFWRVGSLVGTIVRIAFMALLALIAIALGRTWVEPIAAHTAADPVRAGIVGFLAELLLLPAFVIAVVVLAISIIGIPLLFVLVPFAVVGLLVVLMVGFTGVALQLGRLLNARFGWSGRGPYATVAAGVVMIGAFTVLARSAGLAGGNLISAPLALVGYFVEYAAWTIGFGSAIQVWLNRRRGLHPPPLPV